MKQNKIITFFTVVLLLLQFQGVLGQQKEFIKHLVKEGETLTSISRKYQITPFNIIEANSDIKSADDIRPEMLIYIPLNGGKPAETGVAEEVDKAGPEPTGFDRHKVKKRETLFGIAQKYGVTEEQIKKYNSRLYASALRKGDILRVPIFPEPVEIEEVVLVVDTYVVQPKETRWSVANKYGITVDSLLQLNPQLDKNSSYLAVGQELQLPPPPGASLENQEVALFESYKVPKAIGLFRLGQEYQIPVDSILSLNPEITENGGLKEGMVLRLPKQKVKSEEVNTENYIFYEVKPKQTLFGLTQTLKLSQSELFGLNPELENGLKAGMVLKLPKAESQNLSVKNALILDQINLKDSVNIVNQPELLFLLPFRLDRIDLANEEKTENQLKNRRDLKLSLGFYTGAMVALDSIKKIGISVNVKTFDTRLSAAMIDTLLLQEDLTTIDAIIGPVSSAGLDKVAVRANTLNIPVISPTSADNALSHQNVFYSVPRDAVLRERLLNYLEKKRKDQNIIVIADTKHQIAKDSILAKFPTALEAALIDDQSLHLEDFLLQLSEDKENWIFVETEKTNTIASISSILNSASTKEAPIRMFTTHHSAAFEADAISGTHLSNLEFTFPAYSRYSGNNSFKRAYRKKYKNLAPDKYAIRGFDLTMDVLLKLAFKERLVESSDIIGLTEYTENSFDYYKNPVSGYYNDATYLMMYDRLQIKQIKE